VIKSSLIGIWDVKARAYVSVFVAPSVASGLRSYEDVKAREGSPLHDHPGDFAVDLLGTVDHDARFIEDGPISVELVAPEVKATVADISKKRKAKR